jgi:hypothetical protein
VNTTPPPATFKEALRLLYSRYLVAAGIALGVGGAAIVAFLMFGVSKSLEQLAVETLGKALIGAGIGQTLVIIFLGLGGPVRSLKGSVWKATIEAQGDDC